MSVAVNECVTSFEKKSGPSLFTKVSLTGCGAALALGLSVVSVQAAPVLSQVFLIADQSAPQNNAVPQFNVETTSVYELFLNDWGLATSYEKASNFDFLVKDTLSYKSHGNTEGPKTLNDGEGFDQSPSDMGPRVNSEINTWDDMGIVTEGEVDADENADFGYKDHLILNGPQDGFTDLIIAEDAGLDAFQLYLCLNGCSRVFNGLSDTVANGLVGTGDFSLGDTADPTNMDQAYVFLFSENVEHNVGIKEKKNRGGEKLEVDFVGTGHIVTPVPVPAGLPLALTALGAFAWMRRRARH